MIERIYLKNLPLFGEVEIACEPSLNVLSGASGAGKSLLMEAILSLFGLRDSNSEVSEITIGSEIDTSAYGIESEEPTIFKIIKKEKARYFVNNQSISKKNIKELSSPIIKHISHKECNDFENENLLEILDAVATSKVAASHAQTLQEYRAGYRELIELKKELKKIEAEEQKIEELKELVKFEIEKIERIDPKIGEYDELMLLKKNLSKKEKIENLISKTSQIFDFESDANELISFLGAESAAFNEGMNTLRGVIDQAASLSEELENINIEETLDRIEELSSLNKRYGGIQEALDAKERRRQELVHYENITIEKSDTQKKLGEIFNTLESKAEKLSSNREEAKKIVQKELEHSLNRVLLKNGAVVLEKSELYELGRDVCRLQLNGTEIERVSSGEFNRMRLALMRTKIEYLERESAIIILDEVDANLSGEESEGVADTLKELAKRYQIFAISHQPHLPSYADVHFLVKKERGKSSIARLEKEGKIMEIARMISGKEINQEAIDFAKKKLER